MNRPGDHNGVEHFLGEFVSMDARMEERLGEGSFHWFIIRRKSDYPITARGQFVLAAKDGTIAVIVDEGDRRHFVAQVPADEVEGVFEDDMPVEIRKSA